MFVLCENTKLFIDRNVNINRKRFRKQIRAQSKLKPINIHVNYTNLAWREREWVEVTYFIQVNIYLHGTVRYDERKERNDESINHRLNAHLYQYFFMMIAV